MHMGMVMAGRHQSGVEATSMHGAAMLSEHVSLWRASICLLCGPATSSVCPCMIHIQSRRRPSRFTSIPVYRYIYFRCNFFL
jgi:hypothetical protein